MYLSIYCNKIRIVYAMKIWEFFENMNECVYASDIDTDELVYMNKKALRMYGIHSLDEVSGKKCYEVLQHCAAPCAACNNSRLREGEFIEWGHYNPLLNKNFAIKDTVVTDSGRRYRVEIAIDADAAGHTYDCGEASRYENIEAMSNEALRVALQAPTPDLSLQIVLEYIGKALHGERTYIFEKNELGGDDNTYEWSAVGVESQKDTLQNVPEDVCADWYRNFAENRHIVIVDLEDIKESDPLQYDNLKRQDIHSLVVVPLYDNKQAIGFYGVDNPPASAIKYASNILHILGHFIISCIRRRNLVRELKVMSYSDQLTGLGNRYALNKYMNTVDEDRSLGIVYCDVTGLKKVNDTEGHEMGDRLLKNACESLQRVFSGYGLFRIGGDEFLAVANGVTREALDERVGLLKEDMKQHDVNMAVGEVWTHKAPKNPDALLTEAEKQMYQDKAEYYKRAGIDRRRY